MAKIYWINKKDKKNYLNICKYNGVRFSFESGIPEKAKNELSKLINYIRKKFYFPIRFNVCFTNEEVFINSENGEKGYCAFYGNQEAKKRMYPKLYVPALESDNNLLIEIEYYVCLGISMYYQWFFKQDEKLSEKQLNKEADELADFYIKEYFEKSK